MENLFEQLAICVERGKADKQSPYPPEMKDQDGASEIAKQLLDAGASANDVLKKGLMVGMDGIGKRFGEGKAFIPNLLISAKAMNAAMVHLKPYFESGGAEHRGTFIIGTVAGDLHDIGKNIVRMVLVGDGWNVIDLGVDVTTELFLNSLNEHPDAYVAMSALLTTTMTNMETNVKAIKQAAPNTKVFIGGAPVSKEYNDKIGADGFFPDPYSFAKSLR